MRQLHGAQGFLGARERGVHVFVRAHIEIGQPSVGDPVGGLAHAPFLAGDAGPGTLLVAHARLVGLHGAGEVALVAQVGHQVVDELRFDVRRERRPEAGFQHFDGREEVRLPSGDAGRGRGGSGEVHQTDRRGGALRCSADDAEFARLRDPAHDGIVSVVVQFGDTGVGAVAEIDLALSLARADGVAIAGEQRADDGSDRGLAARVRAGDAGDASRLQCNLRMLDAEDVRDLGLHANPPETVEAVGSEKPVPVCVCGRARVEG